MISRIFILALPLFILSGCLAADPRTRYVGERYVDSVDKLGYIDEASIKRAYNEYKSSDWLKVEGFDSASHGRSFYQYLVDKEASKAIEGASAATIKKDRIETKRKEIEERDRLAREALFDKESDAYFLVWGERYGNKCTEYDPKPCINVYSTLISEVCSDIGGAYMTGGYGVDAISTAVFWDPKISKLYSNAKKSAVTKTSTSVAKYPVGSVLYNKGFSAGTCMFTVELEGVLNGSLIYGKKSCAVQSVWRKNGKLAVDKCVN
jgi:hypothetical protein